MRPLRKALPKALAIFLFVSVGVLSNTSSAAESNKPTSSDIARTLADDMNSGANTNVLIRFEVKKSQASGSGNSQVWLLLVLTEYQWHKDGVHTFSELMPIQLSKKNDRWVAQQTDRNAIKAEAGMDTFSEDVIKVNKREPEDNNSVI